MIFLVVVESGGEEGEMVEEEGLGNGDLDLLKVCLDFRFLGFLCIFDFFIGFLKKFCLVF